MQAQTRSVCAAVAHVYMLPDCRYQAILKGSLGAGASGQVDAPISGKPSLTHYTVLQVGATPAAHRHTQPVWLSPATEHQSGAVMDVHL